MLHAAAAATTTAATDDEGYTDTPPPPPAHLAPLLALPEPARAAAAAALLASLSSTALLHDLARRIHPRLHRDIPALLPPELALHILSLTSTATVGRALRVSRAWHRIACDPRVWRALYLRRGWRIDEAQVAAWLELAGDAVALARAAERAGAPAWPRSRSSSITGAWTSRRSSNVSDVSSLMRTPQASALMASAQAMVAAAAAAATTATATATTTAAAPRSPTATHADLAPGASHTASWGTPQLLSLALARQPSSDPDHSAMATHAIPQAPSLSAGSIPSIHLPSQVSLHSTASLARSSFGDTTVGSAAALVPPGVSLPPRQLVASTTASTNDSRAPRLDPHLDYATAPLPTPVINWPFLFRERARLEQRWYPDKLEVDRAEAATRRNTHVTTPPDEAPPRLPLLVSAPTATARAQPAMRELRGHTDGIYTLQFHHDHLVSGSRDRTVRVWDMASGACRQVLTDAHQGSILCLQYDEHDGTLVTGASDGRLVAWRRVPDVRVDEAVDAGDDARHDPERDEQAAYVPLYAWRAHNDSVLNLRMDERVLLTCGKDRVLHVWRRDPPAEADAYVAAALRPERLDALERDDPSLAAAAAGTPHGAPRVTSAARVSELEHATPLRTLTGHRVAINAVDLAGGRAISVSGDRTVRVWDLETGACVRSMDGHERGIACVAWDGVTAFSGSSDCTIRVWDVRARSSQPSVGVISGHDELVRTLAWDGAWRLVSGSYDQTVRLWDVRAAQRHARTHARHEERLARDLGAVGSHAGRVFRVAQDVRRIVSCSQDMALRVWDFGVGIDTRFMQ